MIQFKIYGCLFTQVTVFNWKSIFVLGKTRTGLFLLSSDTKILNTGLAKICFVLQSYQGGSLLVKKRQNFNTNDVRGIY